MVQKLTDAILLSPNMDFLIEEIINDNRNDHRKDKEYDFLLKNIDQTWSMYKTILEKHQIL